MTSIVAYTALALCLFLTAFLWGALVKVIHVQEQVASLDRQVCLHQQALRLLEQLAGEQERAINRLGGKALHKRVDSLEQAEQAHAGLSIMHAESMTRLQSQLDEIRRRPYFVPTRGDN